MTDIEGRNPPGIRLLHWRALIRDLTAFINRQSLDVYSCAVTHLMLQHKTGSVDRLIGETRMSTSLRTETCSNILASL